VILATAPSMTTLPVYDWQEPAHIQEADWDCSQESLEWCLWAYGRTPDDSWMESSLQAGGYVTPAVGCTDASGAGLATWVNEQYSEYGYLASNSTAVSFDQVAEEAASHVHPIAIGGAGWYHWSGVRGYDALLDRLLLANPAPGYGGIYQTMDRAQFTAKGPFNLVRVTHPAAEGGGGVGGPTPSGLAYGPDVSSHQGYVDWAAVRSAGCSFGFTKASGGCWYRNPTLAANWQGMAAAGLARGAYHFAFESSGQPLPGPGPIVEADYFLSTIMPLGLARGDMLVLDIEQGAGPLGHWALDWCRRVEEVAGFPPLIYTGAWFSDPHGFGDVPELARYGLWLADYGASSWPPPPAPWTAAAFWQFTDHATVPGISTPADGNRFNGTAADLLLWGKPGLLPPDDPYAAWAGLIGSGLLDMMETDGTLPAQSRSTWLPLGVSPADIEQALGQNGVNYVWALGINRGFRYPPA
jgi:lysozyme